MNICDKKIDGASQFVSYFQPVLEVLRSVGGKAMSGRVFEEIVARYQVPAIALERKSPAGTATVKNRIEWAGAYLKKSGMLYSPKRGVWALTEEGKTAELSDDFAVQLFRSAKAGFKANEDEDQFPEDEIAPAGVNYWFVGAAWKEGDQTGRFQKEGIWQNGYDEKFTQLVGQMKQGDRIAIKSSYVRKHDVPFENYGRSVSAMKIKLIGTITANSV